MNHEKRLDALIQTAKATNFTIDFLEAITQGLSCQAFLRVIGNVSALPTYMKSSERPYLLRNFNAPSTDTRCSPVSQLDT